MGLNSIDFFFVMAGLDPAIHADVPTTSGASVDARIKSGHDDRKEAIQSHCLPL